MCYWHRTGAGCKKTTTLHPLNAYSLLHHRAPFTPQLSGFDLVVRVFCSCFKLKSKFGINKYELCNGATPTLQRMTACFCLRAGGYQKIPSFGTRQVYSTSTSLCHSGLGIMVHPGVYKTCVFEHLWYWSWLHGVSLCDHGYIVQPVYEARYVCSCCDRSPDDVTLGTLPPLV